MESGKDSSASREWRSSTSNACLQFPHLGDSVRDGCVLEHRIAKDAYFTYPKDQEVDRTTSPIRHPSVGREPTYVTYISAGSLIGVEFNTFWIALTKERMCMGFANQVIPPCSNNSRVSSFKG